MASIKDSTGQDLSAYTPVTPTTPPPASAPSVNDAPLRNPFLRTPLPSLNPVSPDSLRQFFNGGRVPQSRILPLPSTVNSGSGTTYESAFIAGGGSGGSGGSTNITIDANTTLSPTGPVLFTTGAVVTTPLLPPGGKYVGSTLVANTFQLCSITASGPCRVQLYGSALAQQADLARGLDDPTPAGVFQNLVTDVALDTIPLQWNFQDCCASNNEDPQNNTCYVTITNLDNSSDVIFVNIQYVALSLGNNPGAPVISLGSLLGNTPISNSLLSTWGNVAQLTGAIFSGPVSTNTLVANTINATTVNSVDINASGSIVATVIQGDIDAVSITASGSIVGTDIQATGSISTVDITCSGSSVSNTFSGNNITVNETVTGTLNTFAPPTEDNADKTLNHISSTYQNGPASTVSGTTNLTLLTFSVTAVSTSDVFNLSANVMASFGAGDVAAITAKADGTTLFSGYGQFVSQSSSLKQVGQYIGTVTGLAAGTHSISLIISCGATITINAGEACGVLQQISS